MTYPLFLSINNLRHNALCVALRPLKALFARVIPSPNTQKRLGKGAYYRQSFPHRSFLCQPIAFAVLLIFCVTFTATYPAEGLASSPAPSLVPPKRAPQTQPVTSGTAEELLAPLLNIPYRIDGAVTQEGAYTTFAKPTQRFNTPGLNCSGFMLAACRLLLNTPLTVERAGFDRWNDSGPTSAHGHDWDYGWDLVCNIVDSLGQQTNARFLTPDGNHSDPLLLDGFAAQGYDLHAQGQLEAALTRMKPHHVYLLSFNKTKARMPRTLQHYHVGLIILNEANSPLLYQTTTQRKRSYLRDLSTPQGRSSFLKAFANTRHSRKHMAIVEIPMHKGQ